jgi:hypothetical protein
VNVIADTWRQLVRRRLWPVAVLLLAGLVAVPFLLAKEPKPVVPPPPLPVQETTAAEEAATGDPVVALASEGDRSRRRRVLGSRKDPFEPAPAPKQQDDGDDQQQPPTDQPSDALPTDPSGGGTAPTSPPVGVPPTEPVPTEPAPKMKTYPPDALIVRFGDAEGGSLARTTLAKLEALPDDTGDAETEPVLVYMGLTKDDKHAIFLVGAGAEVTGDGECKPHPSSCETIHLRKGETEFFDVTDDEGKVVAQYQLDLIDIKVRKKS